MLDQPVDDAVDVQLAGLTRPPAGALETRPDLPILALTMHEDDTQVFAALRAGARSTSSRAPTPRRSFTPCADRVRRRRVRRGVARRIVAFFSVRSIAHRRAFPELTPREREVLELLAAGCRNHEIARRLSMSEKTVRNHVSQLLTKLQVPDRTDAAINARGAGLAQSRRARLAATRQEVPLPLHLDRHG